MSISANAAPAHDPIVGATDDGRIPGMSDFERTGQKVVRFDPATRTYEIDRPGRPVLRMHGEVIDPLAATAAEAGPGISLPTNVDPPICATSGHRIKVVWSHASGSGTGGAVELIRTILARMNWKLRRESERSSNNRRSLQLKVDCTLSGAVQVHEVISSGNQPEEVRRAVEGALGTPAGADSVKYLIFRDQQHSSLAGVGYGYVGESSSPFYSIKSSSDDLGGNDNRLWTTSAIIWQGSPCCVPPWETHVTLHELSHAMGASQYPSRDPAPFATPGAHCIDGLDVLCYSDGTLIGYTETRCPANGFYDTPEGVPLDCGYDTYFDAEPESGEWLSQYWNVGGSENPFLDKGLTTIGVFRQSGGQWLLRNTNGSGPVDMSFSYSYGYGDSPITGDWDGDGTDTTGFAQGGSIWSLSNMNSPSTGIDTKFFYGNPGDIPIAGDWNGDGIDTIGVWRPSTNEWLLRNSNSSGPADISFTVPFGNPGDIPIAGDWNGDGIDTIGGWRPSTGRWLLRNTNSGGGLSSSDITFIYGSAAAGDKPVVGDWNRDWVDTIGVWRTSTNGWLLRNSNTAGVADISFQYGNAEPPFNDLPVTGDWDGG